MKSLTNRKWNSLNQVKDYIESNNTSEKVISFDGATLTTNKYIYGLAFGQVSIKKNGK